MLNILQFSLIVSSVAGVILYFSAYKPCVYLSLQYFLDGPICGRRGLIRREAYMRVKKASDPTK